MCATSPLAFGPPVTSLPSKYFPHVAPQPPEPTHTRSRCESGMSRRRARGAAVRVRAATLSSKTKRLVLSGLPSSFGAATRNYR
jgi:hypothetical protein